MKSAKSVSTPLAGHLKLSKRMCPTTTEDKEIMSNVPYSSEVGSLMYAMVCTRPDIAHAVGVVIRFLENPGKEHWEAVKWILRYLRGTSEQCLCFGGSDPILTRYTDSDMAGDLDHRNSTSGYVFTFSGGDISWQSRLQKCVVLSTTEAEYIAANEAGKEMIWLKRFLKELGLHQKEYKVYCDSQSAIDLSKNSIYHARMKNIDVRYHWIRENIEDGCFQLQKISTNENPANMLAKVVPRDKFELCKELVGMRSGECEQYFIVRDVELTEELDYSSVVAFIGYSLLVAILRAFNVRDEASRVMVAAPIVAFVTTHILYLNFYQFDYGLNTKVSVAMTMVQFILWAVRAGFTRHPSCWKLWLVESFPCSLRYMTFLHIWDM